MLFINTYCNNGVEIIYQLVIAIEPFTYTREQTGTERRDGWYSFGQVAWSVDKAKLNEITSRNGAGLFMFLYFCLKI